MEISTFECRKATVSWEEPIVWGLWFDKTKEKAIDVCKEEPIALSPCNSSFSHDMVCIAQNDAFSDMETINRAIKKESRQLCGDEDCKNMRVSSFGSERFFRAFAPFSTIRGNAFRNLPEIVARASTTEGAVEAWCTEIKESLPKMIFLEDEALFFPDEETCPGIDKIPLARGAVNCFEGTCVDATGRTIEKGCSVTIID